MAILINQGDAPKFYLYLDDIYGNALSVDSSDFLSLNFSIYTVVGETKTPIEGYENQEIPREYFYVAGQGETLPAYPSTIKGITSSERAKGYNLKFFPYVADDIDGTDTWTTPFNQPNTTYEIDVNFSYYMEDDALDGVAVLNRTIPIIVQTRS